MRENKVNLCMFFEIEFLSLLIHVCSLTPYTIQTASYLDIDSQY